MGNASESRNRNAEVNSRLISISVSRIQVGRWSTSCNLSSGLPPSQNSQKRRRDTPQRACGSDAPRRVAEHPGHRCGRWAETSRKSDAEEAEPLVGALQIAAPCCDGGQEVEGRSFPGSAGAGPLCCGSAGRTGLTVKPVERPVNLSERPDVQHAQYFLPAPALMQHSHACPRFRARISVSDAAAPTGSDAGRVRLLATART